MATHDGILTDLFSTLPEEISNDIFSRVPTKSVGKFRCLSKTWNARLSTPHFINLHLSRNTHKKSLILSTQSKSLHVIKPPFALSSDLELGNTWTQVLSSCNGLVLLLNSENQMFLVNPTTLEQLNVPNLIYDSKKLATFYGFGYDSSTDDYKILVLSVFDCERFGRYYTKVDLYSVKFGAWRSINYCFADYAIRGSSRGAYTNGSIHWFFNRISPRSPPFAIFAFNLATEVFYEIEVPPNMHNPNASSRVFSHEGCLYVMAPLRAEYSLSSGKFDVWVMNEYGMLNSWTKLGSVDSNEKWHTCVPLCFSRDEEIVLLTREYMVAHSLGKVAITYNHNMVVYNLQEGTVKEMIVNSVPASFCDGCSYVDSLVSPKQIASSS